VKKTSFAGSLVLVALAGCSSGGTKTDAKPDSKDAKPKVERKTIDAAAVPKPVTDGLEKAFAGAKATTWTQRGDTYGVKGHAGSRWIDCKFSADGTLTESSEQIAVDAAPDPVKKAFQESAYAKLLFVDATKRVKTGKDGDTLYKFVVKDGEKAEIAVYGVDGKFVKVKDFPKEKFDKWTGEHAIAK
jgi:hypothetical protein